MVLKVAQSFERLEKTTGLLYVDVAHLSQLQVSFQPAVDSWSVLQVLNHLLMAETGTLRYMRNKNKAESLADLDISASFKSFLLGPFLLLPLRFKAPAVVSQPPNNDSIADIRGKWDKHRVVLKDFLGNFPADRTGKMIFRHPLIGPMNIFHTMNFLNNHIRHHRRQIGRLLNHSDFPKN